jgi:hypothetical protein
MRAMVELFRAISAYFGIKKNFLGNWRVNNEGAKTQRRTILPLANQRLAGSDGVSRTQKMNAR